MKYLITLLFAVCPAVFATELSDFDSVKELESALRADDSVRFRTEKGWLIAESGYRLWSFTPDDHPAHPAVVEREVYEEDGAVQMRSRQLCEADSNNCEQLLSEFKGLNSKVASAVRKRQPAEIFELFGAEVTLHGGHGWSLRDHKSTLLFLRKAGASENDSVVGTVQYYRVPKYDSAESFLAAETARRIKSHENDPRVKDPKVVEVLTRHSGADCVRSIYEYQDTGAQSIDNSVREAGFYSLSLRCLHPYDSSIAVDIGFSVRHFSPIDHKEHEAQAGTYFSSVKFLPFPEDSSNGG